MTFVLVDWRQAQLPGFFQPCQQLGAGLDLRPARRRQLIEMLAQGAGQLRAG